MAGSSKAPLRAGDRGFTLIEIILVLTIGAILAGMVVPYFGSGLSGAVRSTLIADDHEILKHDMESLNAYYAHRMIENRQTALTELVTHGANFLTSGTTLSTEYVSFNGFTTTPSAPGQPTHYLQITLTLNDQTLTAIFSG